MALYKGLPMNGIGTEESETLLDACRQVYQQKGCGFLKSVYQECLDIEFQLRRIPCTVQPSLRLTYKGIPLKQGYEPDFICFDGIVIEIQSVPRLLPAHRIQFTHSLKSSGYRLGLLINFGHHLKLEYDMKYAG